MKNKNLIEYDKETQRLKDEITQHLSKFGNLDKLFNDTNGIIQKYFEEQDKYKDIELFKRYLKEKINFYLNSFKLKRKERKLITNELDYIEETFNEIIYFGEFNPIKSRKQILANQTDEEKKINKQRGYFGGLLGKIM